MLDVLLSSASPGQTRPSVADTVDLLSGAVRIRLRRAVDGAGASAWPGALSIAGFLAMLMLVADGARFTVNVPYVAAAVDDGYVQGDSGWHVLAGQLGTAPYWLAWAAVAFLAWRGSRRAAARAACAVTAVQIALVAYGLAWSELWNASVGASLGGIPLPLALVASASLVASPGPGHGARLLGRRGVAGAVAMAAVLATTASAPFMAFIHQKGPWPPWYDGPIGDAFVRWDRILLSVTLMTAVFSFAVLARTRAGRRASALMALGGAPLLAQVGWINMEVVFSGPVIHLLLIESLAGFALVMLIVRIVELPAKFVAKKHAQPSI